MVSSPCSRSAARTWRSNQRMERSQGGCAGANLVGQRRHAQIDAFAPVSFALAVQRLMLAELLEQDHGQQVWSGEAARRHVERCRRLRDLLAFPARRTFPAPSASPSTAAGSTSSVSVMSSPQLRQLRRPAAGTAVRRGNDDALARQMIGERLRDGRLRWNDCTVCVRAAAFSAASSSSVAAASRSSELEFHLLQQLAPRSERVHRFRAELLDLQLEMGDQRFTAGQVRRALAASALATAASASAMTRALRSARISA